MNRKRVEEMTAPFLHAQKELERFDKQMLRLSQNHGVSQEQHEEKIKGMSGRISALAEEAGLSIADLRRLALSISQSCTDIETARTKLIEHNIRLVYSIAKKHRDQGVEFLDLMQEGNIGLMRAADGYDYRLGYKFSTYATYSIMHKIKRAFPEKSSPIRVPLHLYEMKGKIRKSYARLQVDGAYIPSKKIAEHLGVSVEKIMNHRHDYEYLSLHAPQEHSKSDKSRTLSDVFSDKKDPTFGTVSRILDAQLIEKALSHKKITPQEQKVIKMRYFAEDGEVMNFTDVGASLGFSRERARVLENKALEKIQKIISPEYGGQWSLENSV